jgi:hypothetical protein
MVDIVIIPKPPICMRIRIINCPKEEKSFPVSRTINPVTQGAEVAVKRALIKPILFPVLEAAGRLRSIVPIVITARNPNNNICGGESFFSLIVLISVMVLYPFLKFLNLQFNYFFQNFGITRIKTVYISNRPNHIHTFPAPIIIIFKKITPFFL